MSYLNSALERFTAVHAGYLHVATLLAARTGDSFHPLRSFTITESLVKIGPVVSEIREVTANRQTDRSSLIVKIALVHDVK